MSRRNARSTTETAPSETTGYAGDAALWKARKEVRAGIKAISSDIGDVLVHIDPEDDATERPSSDLPGREQLLDALTERWQALEAAKSIEKVHFHYLAGRVDVEIVLPLDLAKDVVHARQLAAELRDCAEREPHVGTATVYFR